MRQKLWRAIVIAGTAVALMLASETHAAGSPDRVARKSQAPIRLPREVVALASFFRQHTGDPLLVDREVSTRAVWVLDLDGHDGLTPTRDQNAKFGRFSILLLQHVALSKVLEAAGVSHFRWTPDRRGVVWFKVHKQWYALSRYKGNVVLDWYAARRVVDGRWSRLDRLLHEWKGVS